MPPIVSLPSGKGAIPGVGNDAMKSGEQVWRPEPESNRRARICSPLRNHSAIGPQTQESVEKIGRAHVSTPVTNAHLVCRLLLETKYLTHPHYSYHTGRANL